MPSESAPQTQPSEHPPQAQPKGGALPPSYVNWVLWVTLSSSILLVLYYYGFVEQFGPDYNRRSALVWLFSAWTPVTDYEHGKLVPFVIIGLIAYRWRDIRDSVGKGSWWGLLSVALGCLFFVAAYRTYQPRIAIGGLPFILWGAAMFLYGWKSARLLIFPLFFIWIAIPLPAFQQATTHLQLIATQLAHHGSGLFGVETYTQGTTVLPVEGDWKPLSIAHGCSGIRSLMALIMISAAWAYIAKISLWKKVLLFASALPLAIVGNALRVISIFVIAEYGSANWASTTWHDWSGLLLFYPITLAAMLGIHSLLEGGLPWNAKKRRQLVRKEVAAQAAPDMAKQPETSKKEEDS